MNKSKKTLESRNNIYITLVVLSTLVSLATFLYAIFSLFFTINPSCSGVHFSSSSLAQAKWNIFIRFLKPSFLFLPTFIFIGWLISKIFVKKRRLAWIGLTVFLIAIYFLQILSPSYRKAIVPFLLLENSVYYPNTMSKTFSLSYGCIDSHNIWGTEFLTTDTVDKIKEYYLNNALNNFKLPRIQSSTSFIKDQGFISSDFVFVYSYKNRNLYIKLSRNANKEITKVRATLFY